MGGAPYKTGTQRQSIAVPEAVPQALTVMAEFEAMRCLLRSTQARAMESERTTRRSPARVGPWAEVEWRAPVAMRAAPTVEMTRDIQPVRSIRSRAKRVAPTARRTGMVPTMSEAWETVVRANPENWMRNWSGTRK